MFQLNPKKKQKLQLEFLEDEKRCKTTSEEWRGKEIRQVYHSGKLIFECLGKCKVRRYEKGVIYMSEHAIGFSDDSVSLRRKREDIMNFDINTETYFLSRSGTVLRFSVQFLNKHKVSHKKIYKMPLSELVKIQDLLRHFPESQLEKSFNFLKLNQFFVISSSESVGIINKSKVIQILRPDYPISSLSFQSGLPVVNCSLFDYSLVKYHPPKTEEEEKNTYKPSPKALFALESSDFTTETIDILWKDHFQEDFTSELLKEWHLDPLDRSYLSSEEFYQEKFYQNTKNHLSLTVQAFYMKKPSSLILLQEALREQERRIYEDCVLEPQKDISMLISENLPLPTMNDSTEQSKILNSFA